MRKIAKRTSMARSKAALLLFGTLCVAGTGHAQSGVTLYGQVDSFVGSNRAAGGDRAYVLGAGGMQTSYWGMRGSEELGGGLKAIFDLNGFLRVDAGKSGRSDTDPMFTRNAFAGLQSNSYGTLKLGRNTTPYFLSTILFNPLVDSYNFAPSIFQTYKTAGSGALYDPGIIGDSGWSNSVVYSTPVLAGLTVNLIYAFGEQPGSGGQNKWGGNVLYFNGPFAATVAFQQAKFNGAPGDVNAPAALAGFGRQNAVQGGLSYDFKVVKLFAQGQYIKTGVDSASGDIRHANGQFGVSVPLGAGSMLVSYAHARTSSNAGEFRRNTAGLAYDYNLSKRTDVYAAYFYDGLTAQAHADTLGVGVRHRF